MMLFTIPQLIEKNIFGCIIPATFSKCNKVRFCVSWWIMWSTKDELYNGLVISFNYLNPLFLKAVSCLISITRSGFYPITCTRKRTLYQLQIHFCNRCIFFKELSHQISQYTNALNFKYVTFSELSVTDEYNRVRK